MIRLTLSKLAKKAISISFTGSLVVIIMIVISNALSCEKQEFPSYYVYYPVLPLYISLISLNTNLFLSFFSFWSQKP